jgi:hypothetical protein
MFDVDYRLGVTGIMHQLWGYKVEEKLHVVVREQRKLSTTVIYYFMSCILHSPKWHWNVVN